MKCFDSNDIRNVVLLSQGGHGSTSLGEAILFNSGAVTRLGSVDEGSAVFDFEDEEKKRKNSISAGIAACEFNNKKLNLIDLPGLADFVGDVDGALRVSDGAVLVVSAVDGVEVRTERLWEAAGKLEIPRAIFINKIDRDRASFDKIMEEIRSLLGVTPLPLTVPIGKESNFRGVVDMVENRAALYPLDGSRAVEYEAIPAEMVHEIRDARANFVEEIAATDEALMEMYFEDGVLDPATLKRALASAFTQGLLVPVFVGTATKNAGIDVLMDFITTAFPAPGAKQPYIGRRPGTNDKMSFTPNDGAPFSAYVFKTLAHKDTGQLSLMRVCSGTISSDTNVDNVTKDQTERFGALMVLRGKEMTPVTGASCGDIIAVAKLEKTITGDTFCMSDAKIQYPGISSPPPTISFAIEAVRQGDEDKIYQGLAKLSETDPSLRLVRDPLSGTVLSGMGQLLIESSLRKLHSKFNVEAKTALPKVHYKETIKGTVSDVRYRHKKQSGGIYQFAEVTLDISPTHRGEGFIFENTIVGGAIPRLFIAAVETAVAETMARGVIAGHDVVDVRVRLHEGKFTHVDSSEMAFKIAAKMAFKSAIRDPRAKAILLEPIMEMEVTVPEDKLGDIMGDLLSRRGRPMGTQAKGKYQVIKAQAPLAEVLSYRSDLRSMTGGRGEFIMSHGHHEQVPRDIASKIIAAYNNEDDE